MIGLDMLSGATGMLGFGGGVGSGGSASSPPSSKSGDITTGQISPEVRAESGVGQRMLAPVVTFTPGSVNAPPTPLGASPWILGGLALGGLFLLLVFSK